MWIWAAVAVTAILIFVVFYFFRLAAVRTRKTAFPGLMPDNDVFREHIRCMDQDRAWLLGNLHEQVAIKSDDGLTLRGRLFIVPGAQRFVLLSHGYRSGALQDFPSVSRFYLDNGYGVLLIDQRACGESDGRYIGFGALEQHDLVRWTNYLAERFPDCHIFMDGVSMGSTAVLLALGQDLPPNVRGAIADCGFTSPMAIMRHVQKTVFPASGAWVIWGVRLLLILFAHYDPAKCSTLDALKRAKTPVLFIHGDADKFVPVEMSKANYEACASEKQLIIVPGAGHGESYVLDRSGCERALKDFFAKYEPA